MRYSILPRTGVSYLKHFLLREVGVWPLCRCYSQYIGCEWKLIYQAENVWCNVCYICTGIPCQWCISWGHQNIRLSPSLGPGQEQSIPTAIPVKFPHGCNASKNVYLPEWIQATIGILSNQNWSKFSLLTNTIKIIRGPDFTAIVLSHENYWFHLVTN